MKYTEEKFLSEVKLLHPDINVIGRFKSLMSPILVEDKYGVLQIKQSRLLLRMRPSIMQALNKTQYFMNQLKDKQPKVYEAVTPVSEYVNAREKMLFKDKFGIVSMTPDNLMSGHLPTIRSAINRKEYFKNQLLYIYGDKYQFNITSTDRNCGRIELICPIHGIQSVDTNTIFLGIGCPACNKTQNKSNVFYFIELFNNDESFYKIGVSYYKNNGKIRRFDDYIKIGYKVKVIYTYQFPDPFICKDFEIKLKQVIKPFLYTPKNWPALTSTECFSKDIKESILKIIEYDIVSTSMETQSSLISGQELTTPVEDIEV